MVVVVPIVLLALAANACDDSLASAALAVRQNEFTKAAAILEGVRLQCGESAKFHELAAIVAELNGNFTQASKEFQKCFTLSPERTHDPTLLLWYAQALIESHQTVRLSAFLAAKGRVLTTPLLFSLGTLFAKHGDYDQAIHYLQQIPSAAADDAVYFNLALAHSHLRRFDEARKYYFLAIDKHPDHVEAYFRVGLDYAASGDTRKAIPWLFRAKDLAPGRPDIAYALTEQLLALEYFDSAEQVIEAGFAANPQNPMLTAAKGDLLRLQGDAGASALYESALKLEPRLASAQLGLALIEKSHGHNAEALKRLSEALSASPENPAVLAELGALEVEDADWRAAYSHLSKAWSLDPSVPDLGVHLARAMRNSGRPNEALHLLQPLAQTLRDSPALHSELAQIYRALGRPADAEAEFSQISALRARSSNALRFEAAKTYVH